MAITLETINVGVENQATGSDSLFTAFTKTQNNFATLSACASPYNTFNGGNGIQTEAFSSNGTVVITNTGILNILPGTGITATNTNGNVTISVSGTANGEIVAGVTNVGISSSTLDVSDSPIISNGVMTVDLQTMGDVTPGTYTAATVSVDEYGRITAIEETISSGTVTSVDFAPGVGIQIDGGPITTSGSITVTNTGVTRLNAGPGILLSDHTGEITVSASNPNPGTVTSVEVTSNTLVITGSPITSTGIINIESVTPASSSAPSTASSTGTPGQIAYSSGYVYVCIATNTWKRAALSTW